MSDDLGFVHRWIAADQADSAPTLLLLHGTGGNENDLIELGASLWPQANLLSPRGRVLENGHARFFRRLAEGVFDEEDLKNQTGALADFIRRAAINYDFDAERVVVLGFSNGANIAASLLLLSPKTLRGAILLRAMVPLQPSEKTDSNAVEVLLLSGENDPIVPAENANRLAQMLREHGANVSHQWTKTGHNLTSADVQSAQNWLAKISLVTM